MRWRPFYLAEYRPPSTCEWGITEGLAAALGGGLLGGLGAGALVGAGGGALLSEVTGGNPLTGALTGGLTGGAIGGFGPLVGSTLGIGTTGGDVLVGAGAGLVGSEVTGGNPLTGALTGGAGGLLSGVVGSAGGTTGSPSVTSAPTVGAGGGTSAASTASAPAGGAIGAGGGAPVDLASGLGLADSDLLSGFTGGGSTAAGAAGSAAGASGASAAAGGGSNWATSLFGNNAASNLLGKIPATALVGGGLLGADLLMGDQPLPAEKQLQAAEAQAGSTGQALSSYIFSGTLPPGAQQAVTASTNAAKAQVQANYAKLGLSGSTMEGQALQQIDQASAAQTFQFASQLLQQGANYTQISDQMLSALLQTQEAQQSEFTKALAGFAGSLAGAKLGQT
jgi:hypothetical protein